MEPEPPLTFETTTATPVFLLISSAKNLALISESPPALAHITSVKAEDG